MKCVAGVYTTAAAIRNLNLCYFHKIKGVQCVHRKKLQPLLKELQVQQRSYLSYSETEVKMSLASVL